MGTVNPQVMKITAGRFIASQCANCDHQCTDRQYFKQCTDHAGSCINWENQGFVDTYSDAIKAVMRSIIEVGER